MNIKVVCCAQDQVSFEPSQHNATRHCNQNEPKDWHELVFVLLHFMAKYPFLERKQNLRFINQILQKIKRADWSKFC